MGKNSKRDRNGFVELVPCTTSRPVQASVSRSASAHTKESTAQGSVKWWEERYRKLQEESEQIIRNLYQQLAEADATIKTMDESLKIAEEIIEGYSDSINRMRGGEDDDDIHTSGRSRKEFTSGVGLSIEKDGSPKLYRISDQDGPLIPEHEFNGASIELQPGRGFKIKAGWKRKK